ncbi:hypothetical protein [Nodosilinea nodulosa]|uniref:hypothetical protein n=1 Tax=Nodosilinea nodulosa TaxID=416001 RepID=UPI00031AB1D1|nr:hypothetical protein [Nodosilinea nodulosa]
MRGRLIDAWKYTWLELWEPLEQLEIFSDDVYTALFEELEKALLERLHYKETPAEEIDERSLKALLEGDDIYAPLLSEQDLANTYIQSSKSDEPIKVGLKFFSRKAFRERIYVNTANDSLLSKNFIQGLDSANFAGDPALVMFFQNAYDVFAEYNEELCDEYFKYLNDFIICHNLRYKLQRSPFRLQPHLPGVFAALFSEILRTSEDDIHMLELVKDFEHSFNTLSRSQREVDMKTCIAKACNLVEAVGSRHTESKGSESKGSDLGTLCASINCWPHPALRDAIRKIYAFCSDYPGIRHAGSPKSKLRPLDLRDSIIVPILLLAASSYFLTEQNLTDILGINAEDV